jgi:WD40 repeat protein
VERDFQLGEKPKTVFFSPDGERVAYLKDSLLEIWDVAAGAKLRSLATKLNWWMLNGAFDTPHERLVAGYVNEQADTVGWALWKLDTGERTQERELPGLGWTYPNSIDLTKAGDRLAIGFDEALLVDGMTDFQPGILSRFDSTIAVAFSPTNTYLAAANIRGSIIVWNLAANRQSATLQLPTQRASQICLAFSADGGRLVASNADRVQVWDLTRADEKTLMTGHNGGIPCATFSPDGRLLATGGKDKVVRFWDASTGQHVQTLPLDEKVQALAFSPDGRLLAVGYMGRKGAANLRLIDVKSMESVYEAKPAMGEVLSLAWSEAPDGRYLAGCGEHGLALWKVSQGLPVRMETVLELDRGRCLAAVLHREAGVLVWAEEANGENRLNSRDLSTSKMATLNAPEMNQGWHGVALLPDGQSIIFVSKSGVAEVWDVKNDRRIDSFGEPGTFNAPQIALSPNGKWLAALTQPDTVSVWHRPTGKNLFTLRPETGTVWSLAWDPSSEHLAVGQSDGGLAIWHLPKIQEKLTQSGLSWKDED